MAQSSSTEDVEGVENVAVASSSAPSDAESALNLANREKGEHGCTHYRRRCKLVTPCCGEVFWCRHCHNEAKSQNEADPKNRHELDRKMVKELVCALCDTRQPVSQQCQQCHVAFGAYTCMDCVFFDDEVEKKQFHCGECGICRVGGRERFFHCKTCGCCYDKRMQGNHVCVENSMKQNCPVCFEFLFDSVRPTAVLNCGHTIHETCLLSMRENRQMSCPICMKSYEDMTSVWRHMEAEIAVTPMPQEYANWKVDVLCNDCNMPSKVQFHILGLKCSHCCSYNTRRIREEQNQLNVEAGLNELAAAPQTDAEQT
ncbi:hypothetical protein ABBQ38_011325 [Trebouxia sp. C0009 RCD-2024]